MAKYTYPAVLTTEEGGGYSVCFPDIEGCYTQGDNVKNAIFMAEDALKLMLREYEDSGKQIPEPSSADKIKTKNGEILHCVSANTMN